MNANDNNPDPESSGNYARYSPSSSPYHKYPRDGFPVIPPPKKKKPEPSMLPPEDLWKAPKPKVVNVERWDNPRPSIDALGCGWRPVPQRRFNWPLLFIVGGIWCLVGAVVLALHLYQ